jgi:predicted HTH domain antitoxin
MTITVDLPDDIATRPDAARHALEALVIEGYRSGVLSSHQCSALLGMTKFEFDGFLKHHRVWEHAYDVDDFEQDVQTLEALKAAGKLK